MYEIRKVGGQVVENLGTSEDKVLKHGDLAICRFSGSWNASIFALYLSSSW